MSTEALTEAEHFQNQFIVQRKTLDELTERLQKTNILLISKLPTMREKWMIVF